MFISIFVYTMHYIYYGVVLPVIVIINCFQISANRMSSFREPQCHPRLDLVPTRNSPQRNIVSSPLGPQTTLSQIFSLFESKNSIFLPSWTLSQRDLFIEIEHHVRMIILTSNLYAAPLSCKGFANIS